MNTSDNQNRIGGPVMALDLGQKRIGVAVSDDLLISTRRLQSLTRSSWKQLLRDVSQLAQRFDAKTLVIGLPLRLDGEAGSAAQEVERTAQKFARSLDLPVYLQDERLTSVEAEERLRSEGLSPSQIVTLVDSEAAVVILNDFISGGQKRLLLRRE
jgi:putative Holliday junction resolvase